MLLNYLRISWRNLRKQTFYSLLNIFGLSLGLTSSMLIAFYVIDELNFDRHFENAERIFRVDADIRFGGADMALAVTPDALAFTLKKDYPQVEQVTRLRGAGSRLVRRLPAVDNQKEENVYYADSTFFKVFSVALVAGDPAKVLSQANTAVISVRDAEKYFGSENPVGKPLLLDNLQTYTVSGVMDEVPEHSHMREVNMLLSMSSNEDSRRNDWAGHNFITYLLFRAGTDPVKFEENFETVFQKYTSNWLQRFWGASLNEMRKGGSSIRYSLIPITAIHLYSDRTGEINANGNIDYVYIFGLVAIFLLAIACVNFMNLSTARSVNRAKEVAVRKALGSGRLALVGQFLVESIMLCFFAMFLAIVMVAAFLPLFNNLAGKDIGMPVANFWFWIILGVTIILVGVLAGSYPAFYLSAFKPIKVLKNSIAAARSGGGLRSALVVFQFTSSMVLIVGTCVIYYQLNYVQTKELGFDKEQVLIVDDGYALGSGLKTFKERLQQISNVENVTVTSFLPTPSARTNYNFYLENQMQQDKGLIMEKWAVDLDFVKTLSLQVREGRTFNQAFPSDSTGIVINEAAAKLLGIANPVGKKLFMNEDVVSKKLFTYTIIGVVKNFHFESLRKSIGALSLVLGQSNGLVAVRLKGGDVARTVRQAEGLWKELTPGQPFSYHFMDVDFDRVYRAEQRVGRIFVTFAVISIMIGCLGLFGLSAYTAEKRTKEIGVRKVLGASVLDIVTLLSKDFLRLIVIAIGVGSPIAWYIMHIWLKGFAYRIELPWWIFVLAGSIALLIALMTVSFQSVRAAVANPVKSLRAD